MLCSSLFTDSSVGVIKSNLSVVQLSVLCCAALLPRNQVGMIQTRNVAGLCSVAVCETGSDLLLFPEGAGRTQ